MISIPRHRFALLLLTAAGLGCDSAPASDATTTNPPSAPAPVTLAVNPLARKATAQPGTPAPNDNAAVTMAGDRADTVTWVATSRQSWVTLTTALGKGSGTVAWSRSTAGLHVGTYVDTIIVSAAAAKHSPVMLFDTLEITAAPVPLALTVNPPSRSATAVEYAAVAGDNVGITLSGDGAASTPWSVRSSAGWDVIQAAGGTGSGNALWSRNANGLAPGVYVDTLTVTAPGAAGSPARVLDSLTITAPPVPLALAVAPHSFNTAITQGDAALAATATVSITGDNAAHTDWTAAKRKSWTTLTAGAGTGNGTVAWTRTTAALAPGTYVDTITVSVAGASGSPAMMLDSIVVTAAGGGGATADLGVDADLHGKQVFPASNAWNQPVDTAQVDPNSNLILSTIGLNTSLHPDWGSTWGIPYTVVPDNTPRVNVPFTYASESDPGPYPVPANPVIEGNGTGDAHLLVITQNEWKLYEIFSMQPNGVGWTGGSGAIFDLTNGTTRPAGWTSADAAGLPIFPGLVRYDEVYLHGAINHALRFTVQHTRNAYVAPASHVASSLSGAQYAPMGMRVRLKASFDISGYPAPMQVILRALKKYGMMVADNGSNFFVSGTPDPRWNDDYDNLLKQVKVGDFEVVKMTGVVTP